MASVKEQITEQMKVAMKAQDKERLAAIRLILAALKQVEVDERIDLTKDDTRSLAILDKMLKQRRDSIEQFTAANRMDLVEKEDFEVGVIKSFMPAQLSEAEIDAEIENALTHTGATSVKDMGKVMGELKPKLQGRADLGSVGAKIKKRLEELS